MAKHFLDGLDFDLKQSLLKQLKILWAHSSTAIEGNSLTLGETHQVLTEGLTIQGKPLKDHNEVVGHAKAEDLMENLIKEDKPITNQNLFDLHQAVQTQTVTDVYQPIGAWKNQPNSAFVVINEKQVVNDTYARPENVAILMATWLDELNERRQNIADEKKVLEHYAWLHASFVRIHPFADGNGRMARLLANIPVLIAGSPPIIIPKEKRTEYIHLLAQWQLSIGSPLPNQSLVVVNKEYEAFLRFCQHSWEPTQKIVKEVHQIQKKRKI